jgi:hypothetical protein
MFSFDQQQQWNNQKRPDAKMELRNVVQARQNVSSPSSQPMVNGMTMMQSNGKGLELLTPTL